VSETSGSGNSAPPEALLRLESVDTYYGPIHILQGLSLHVRAGELCCAGLAVGLAWRLLG